jgi:hypothetical protein
LLKSIEMDTKLSAFQKEIQEIENPILCVAKAERMVFELGKSLIADTEMIQENNVTETHDMTEGEWSLDTKGITTPDSD